MFQAGSVTWKLIARSTKIDEYWLIKKLQNEENNRQTRIKSRPERQRTRFLTGSLFLTAAVFTNSPP
ncbi:MAG: hypothetical protein A4E74_00478 [Syntrophus sp. PtaB.Bin075]|nr:MAG: hypothetical protein A4E74_00478 [Syntrophus sp. PtaB.Bin075]